MRSLPSSEEMRPPSFSASTSQPTDARMAVQFCGARGQRSRFKDWPPNAQSSLLTTRAAPMRAATEPTAKRRVARRQSPVRHRLPRRAREPV
eukprot:5285304-Prymnesium_polylepis.1